MAIVTPNAFINGLTGTLGNTVFKTLRGKTIAANRPKPSQKQSEQQRTNRSRFREATVYAKAAILDPIKKEYYRRKAKHLKLPNAYTAAITNYMRKPLMKVITKKQNGDILAGVCKKNFRLTKAEVYKKDQVTQAPILVRSIIPTKHNEWIVCLTADEILTGAYLRVEDEPGNQWVMTLDS